MSRRPSRPPGEGAPRLVALAGGVGAARFLRGLAPCLPAASLTVVVNTADDVERHGLWVSPDIDSVVYGLADLHDRERGWGRREETWRCLQALDALGEDTWFQLGDLDLATHIWRTARRREGQGLAAITAAQCAALGVSTRVLPMSDDVVTTRVTCEGGEMHLQEWFVRERCAPAVSAVRFAGARRARPAPMVLEAIAEADAVVVCPSNPVISVAPILAVPGVREALREVPLGVAVTPLIRGAAVKGPTVDLLRAVGVEATPAGVASLYADFCQAMVVDTRDADAAPAVTALGVRAVLTDTLMSDDAAARRLAMATLREGLGFDAPSDERAA